MEGFMDLFFDLARLGVRLIHPTPIFQRYELPGATLDVHLEPFRGNLYGWLGLTGVSMLPAQEGQPPDKGLIEIFPGGRLDLDTLECSQGKVLLPND
jgi:hypothetical protein